MARPPKGPKQVETLTHDEASRRNIPTAELQSTAEYLEELNPAEPVRYARARPLEPGTKRERDEDLDPQIIWNGARIRRDVALDKIRIENPTQNLESYFLDVVQKARAAQETSGAQSGARVAAYLRGDAEAKPATDRILERLTRTETEIPVVAPVQPVVPAANEQRLEELTKASEPAAAPTTAQPKSEEKKVDLSKADEKLSSLLGGGPKE